MKIFFEIISGFFFFLSILVGLFFLRGDILFSGNTYGMIKTIMIPGYLIITGLMFGYLVANVWSRKNSDEAKVYSKSFIIGILCGVVLALAYMFL